MHAHTHIQQLGYEGTMGYQVFLYPNENDMRKLLIWLVSKIPKSDAQDDEVEEVLGVCVCVCCLFLCECVQLCNGSMHTYTHTGGRALLKRSIVLSLKKWMSSAWNPLFARTYAYQSFSTYVLQVPQPRTKKHKPSRRNLSLSLSLSVCLYIDLSMSLSISLSLCVSCTVSFLLSFYCIYVHIRHTSAHSHTHKHTHTARVDYCRNYQPLIPQQCPAPSLLAPSVFERNSTEVALEQEQQRLWEAAAQKGHVCVCVRVYVCVLCVLSVYVVCVVFASVHVFEIPILFLY